MIVQCNCNQRVAKCNQLCINESCFLAICRSKSADLFDVIITALFEVGRESLKQIEEGRPAASQRAEPNFLRNPIASIAIALVQKASAQHQAATINIILYQHQAATRDRLFSNFRTTENLFQFSFRIIRSSSFPPSANAKSFPSDLMDGQISSLSMPEDLQLAFRLELLEVATRA